MKIGYSDILKIYNNTSTVFLCQALFWEFKESFDRQEFLKCIGIDLFGPVLGRFWYLYACIFKDIPTLKITELYPTIVDEIDYRSYSRVGISDPKEMRTELLEVLARCAPDRRFEVVNM